MRAGQPGVHAFGQFRVNLASQRPQSRGVGVDHVDELGPDQGRSRCQVQVVADQHRLADVEVLAYRTGGVGEHDNACAGRAGRPHRVYDVGQVMAFVGVHTTGQHQHAVLTDTYRQHLTGVACRRRWGESGKLGHRYDRGCPAQSGNGWCPA